MKLREKLKKKKFKTLFIIFFILLFISLISTIIFIIAYNLQIDESIVYDWKYRNVSNLSINARYYYTCEWDDSSSENKTCNPIIEIKNTGKDDVNVSEFAIIADFPITTPTFETSETDSTPYNYVWINRSCINYSEHILAENCTVQIERIDWGGTFGTSEPYYEIQPNKTIGIKVTFSTGVYNGGSYNFSFKESRNNETLILDPDISNCDNLTSANTIYNLTQNVSSTDTCMWIQADNITLNCNGYKITHDTDGIGGAGVYSYLGSGSYDLANISNCIITTSSTYGSNSIDLTRLNNATIFNNKITRTSNGGGYGISLSNSDNTLIYYNNFSGGYIRGMYIDSDHINISRNNFTGYGEGITIYSANGVTIDNNFILTTETFRNAIDADSPFVDVNITNCYLESQASDTQVLKTEDDIRVKDTILNCTTCASASNRHSFNCADTSINNFTNVTFNDTRVNFLSNCRLDVYWYVDVYVNDSSGNAIGSATVNCTDVLGSLKFLEDTNSSGYIIRKLLKAYRQNSTLKTEYNNHEFKANKSGYPIGYKSENITTNRIESNPVVITLGGDVGMINTLSSNLTDGINFTVPTTPVINLSADGNNGTGKTSYSAYVTSDSGNIDLWIKASGNLASGGNSILLNNEKFYYNLSNFTVPDLNKISLTTSYVRVAENVTSGTTIYFKFYLNVTGGQIAGVYNNTIYILANQTVL